MREKSIDRSNLKIIAVFVAVILAGVFISQLTGCGEEYRTVCVVETKGVVEAVKDKIVYPAYSGMMLQEGYSIETIGDSFVRLVLDGDKYVKLEPGSKLVCEALGTVGSGKTKLSLEKGSMTAELVSPLKDDEEFTVNTPNAVLAVRGTFFRVDLNEVEDGDLVADVLTYGGQVAIRRILPTGKIVNEEVLIDAGYKVRVNMDTKNTVYVVDGIKTVEPDKVKVPEPINVRDIPDEDMVDIYFSVQNGHELFISEEETATLIEEREIQIEEYTPVYEKAEMVAEKLEAGEISSIPVIQENEAKSRTSEDTGNPSEDSSDKSSTKDTDTKESEKEDVKEDSKDKTKDTAKGTGGKTSTTIPVVDNTQTTPVAVPTTGTTESGRGDTGNTSGDGSGGESSSSSDGSGSGSDGSSGGWSSSSSGGSGSGSGRSSGRSSGGGSSHTHSYTSSVTTEPTCTGTGVRTYTCSCGDSYTETIDATGHNYTDSITKQPTCTETGIRTYTCSCGDSYTETIDATGHNYTDSITKQPTCTRTGIRTYTCTCGDSYTEDIPALGGTHTPMDPAANETACSICGEKMVKINDGMEGNFKDSNYCSYVRSFSTDGDEYLDDDELDSVTQINPGHSVIIRSLAGTEYFRNLEIITVTDQSISGTLDLSGLANLRKVDISGCGSPFVLNLANCGSLTYVNAKNCIYMTSVDVSGCTQLEILDLQYTRDLEGVNVSGCNAYVSMTITTADTSKTFHKNLPNGITGYKSTMKINDTTYPGYD